MNTIKIFLAESGRIADLHKDFPLYRGQFNDKLLNVYVPTSILAPSFSIQHYIGQILGTTAPTSLELADFVAANTYPSRKPAQGDIVEFCDTDDQEFFIYEFNGTAWTSTEVDSFGTLNTIAGTSIKIGMTATKRNGTVYTSKSYFMRYLKTLTYQNVEYALYERKLPKEFTMFAGQGQNAPILIANVVNVDTADKTVLSLVTSQTCSLDVMESTMLDQDDPIQATAYEKLEADVNTLSAKLDLKQDRKSNELSTVADHIVPAINEINTKALNIDAQINEEGGLADRLTTAENDIDNIEAEQLTQNASIQANTDDINGTEQTKGLLERVSDLENTAITGETYIGTESGSVLPTNAQLDAFVLSEAGREPKGGDYVYFTLLVSGGTDKNYKYTYSSISGWNGAEIPAMEKADNSTYGIVKGSYTGNTNTNLQVNIQNGEFSGISVVDGNSTLRDVREYLNTTASSLADNISQTNTNKNNISTNTGNISTLQGQMTNILNGSTAVGKATSADNDGNGRNIVGTYLTQTAGVTKTQMRNYALPRAFNDVSFLEANNAYGDTIPQGSSPLYTATSSNIGDTTLMYANKTVGNYTFQLGSKNSYTTTMYLTASADCTVAYRLTTEVYLNGDWVLLNAELTDPITMVANVVKKVNFGSPFNSLSEVIELNENDIIRQTLEVVTETSASITFSVYSNETYPSTFYLNTTAQTIITAQGEIGEIPVLSLYGTLDNGTISYEIPEGVILNNNTIVMLNLYYAEDIESGTYIDLKYGLEQVKIITPYNIDGGNTATIEQLSQVYVEGSALKFLALIQEDNGDYYAVANIDNLALIKSAISGLETTTNTLMNYMPLYNKTTYKAFARVEYSGTGANIPNPTSIAAENISRYTDLQVGDKILVFVTIYNTDKTQTIEYPRKIVRICESVVTSISGTTVYVTSSQLGWQSYYDRLFAFKSEVDAKQDALPTTSTAGQVLKSTSTAGTVEWGSIPDTNTWRPIKVDGTEKLDSSISGNALDLVGGTNVTLTESNGAVTISATDTNDNQKVKTSSVTFGDNDVVEIVGGSNVTVTGDASAKTITISATDTTYSSLTASQGGTDVSLVTTGEKYTWNSKQDALSTTQMNAVNSGIDSTKVGQIATNTTNIGTNTGDISAINAKIPTEASSNNQLADKSFVNSSIATNTANFIGTFANVSDLEDYVGTITNNDYAFVVNSVVQDNGNDFANTTDLNNYDKTLLTNFDYAWVVNGTKFDLYRFDIVNQTWGLRVANTNKADVTLNTAYNRYKATVSGSSTTWAYEYTLNNSSFTAVQWAAINSGATSSNIGQIATNTGNISSLSSNKADKSATVSNVSYDSSNKKLQQTINGSTTDVVTFGANAFTNTSIPTQASDINALPSSTKYGASLSVSGTSVQLKDQDGNNLGSAIATQDTTYSSLSASNGGTDVSLVTTGEKYTWNNKQNALPTTSTAGRVLKSTSTSGTTQWGTLSASDVGALPSNTTYVSSVNGQSGAVTGLQPTMSAGTGISISSNTVSLDGVIPYTTTAPSAANNTGVKIAILSSEPATKYAGWLYFITE